MKNDFKMGRFQELTEEEAYAVNGGGIATRWIELGREITLSALNTTRELLSGLNATRAIEGVNLARDIVTSVFANLISGLRQRGL